MLYALALVRRLDLLPLLRLRPSGVTNSGLAALQYFDARRGRTSSSDFQVHLATIFHKVVHVPLPSWPCSRDYLTVWRCERTHDVLNATS